MKVIPGCVGYYACEQGHIWSHKRATLKRVSERPDKNGYSVVSLFVAGRNKYRYTTHPRQTQYVLADYFGLHQSVIWKAIKQVREGTITHD